MDWATAAIEAVGLLILGIWIIIPVHEFQGIFAKIRHREQTGENQGDHRAPGGSDEGGGPPTP